MDNQLIFKKLIDVDLSDLFFDSLRADYPGFDAWFNKKAAAGASAFIFEVNAKLEGFLFLKSELNVAVTDTTPHLPVKRWLKIGTFKINPHGTKLGERFLKKALDSAFRYNLDAIYVTVFPKHSALINLFKKYGFEKQAEKATGSGVELVLVKDLAVAKNDMLLDYPKFRTLGNQKFLLAIYPQFHTQLFPDSILNNESWDDLKDVSHTNSIEKAYICSMDCSALRKGDAVIMYRTTDEKGRAHYRSVVSSVCIVEEIKSKIQFTSLADYLAYCEKYSVFNRQELTQWYNQSNRLYVIKMIYNGAFKKRITRGSLIDDFKLSSSDRWGLYPLTDEQFNQIIKKGDVYESLIIH